MVPMIHVTDHLGSVRAVVDGVSGEVVETNDYYPFGSRWNVAAGLKDDSNRFRYNSKEEQSSLYPESVRNAVSYIDYGARQYDPIIGRWFAQDPLSEKYYGISPYAFCAGNPVKYLDPDGEDPTLPARMAIGAAIGGAVSGTAAIIKGKSFTEVIAATAGGAVDGAIGSIGFGVGAKLLSGMFGGGIGNFVEQLINKAFGNQTEIDWAETGLSAAFGAMTGTIEGAGDDLGKYIEDFYSSDETVKSIANEIKDNSSRKMTNKKATKEAKRVAEEAQKKEKDLVEKSTEVITNTWDFYYNLHDE